MRLPGSLLVTNGNVTSMQGSTEHFYSRWVVLQTKGGGGDSYDGLWGSEEYAHCSMPYSWADILSIGKVIYIGVCVCVCIFTDMYAHVYVWM